MIDSDLEDSMISFLAEEMLKQAQGRSGGEGAGDRWDNREYSPSKRSHSVSPGGDERPAKRLDTTQMMLGEPIEPEAK